MDCEPLIQAVQNGKDWGDYLSTLLIAVIVVIIAFQQWLVNSKRLKHELFDRRYEQFIVVKEFICSIVFSRRSKTAEEEKYSIGTKGLRFIFDEQISSYLRKNIWEQSIRLHSLESMLEGENDTDKRKKMAQEKGEIIDRFNDELAMLEERFSKYLQLKH